MRSHRAGLLLLVTLVMAAGACASPETAAPRCQAGQRLAIVAQSVPAASYLPCIDELPPGWEVDRFHVDNNGTRFSLLSDRADEPVDVRLDDACDVGAATPVTPRDEGVRTLQRVDSVSPRYTGALFDVFPGGCVSYEFAFERGPHIALTEAFHAAVQLYSRRQLRQELRDALGITLDP